MLVVRDAKGAVVTSVTGDLDGGNIQADALRSEPAIDVPVEGVNRLRKGRAMSNVFDSQLSLETLHARALAVAQ